MIQYYLDLFSAGLEESAFDVPLTIQDRRQKLEAYCSRWWGFEHAERTPLAPPLVPNVVDPYADKGFLIYGEGVGDGKENIHFVRLPSPVMEVPRKEWTIRGLPSSAGFRYQQAIYPPLDLLAIPVVSQEEQYACRVFWLSPTHGHE